MSQHLKASKNMTQIPYFILYIAGAWVSQRHAAEYWVAGPVFGIVAVVWAAKSLKEVWSKNALAFVLMSTLVYALVYHIARQSWSSDSVIRESLCGPLPTGVVVGSLLLPMVQSLCLGTPRLSAFKGAFVLILSFYVVTLMANVADYIKLGENFNFIAIAVFVWQGIYLLHFFPERLSGSKSSG